MKIDHIEKCKALLDKRAILINASDMLEKGLAKVVIIQGTGMDSTIADLSDEDLNMAVQDAIADRINRIERQIELL